jgi:dipeptidyl aminopeptidase/acylaminoacyl peptidase
VVVRSAPGSDPVDVTPAGFNVRTKVHEYGGGGFLVHRGSVFFSNFADQRLYRQDAGSAPVAITPETEGRHRYADGRVTPDGRFLICVRERHEGAGEPDEVVNEIVALPPDGSAEPVVLAGGHDFYSNPRISPDGSRLCYLTWDLPFLPWDGTELWTGELGPGGDLSNPRRVAGHLAGNGAAGESIFAPDWSPQGELHLVSDRTDWWNLYRVRDGREEPLAEMEAEFGWPQWVFGGRSFGFLEDGRIVCLYGRGGVQHAALLDPETGELMDLDLPHTAIHHPYLATEGSRVALIAGGPAIPAQVVMLDFDARSADVLRESARVPFGPSLVSIPRAIEFPTEGGLTAHAHYYPPVGLDLEAPEGELPPLIVRSHGGPTSEATAEFDMEVQYFTSRGFAMVDVNYGGSTGFGRAYRERLYGTWGVLDTMDCIDAARYLVSEGLADGDRLAITGGSAGGYVTLCALTFHDDFAVGASYFGLADLEPFAAGGTHKFESRYTDQLVGPYPEQADTYRARSPIHFVDMLSCPVILLQGDEDEIVPPAQAEIMVDAMEAKGLPYAYILFPGEQHGFRKAEHIARAAEAELSFYLQIFGVEPGDPIERVEIVNLPNRR